MSNVIKLKRGSGSDPTASDLVVGELAIRTDTGKIFLKKDNGNIAEVSGGGGVSDGDKGDITVSNSGDTFTIDSGVIDNANIASNAAIAGSKISPNFGSSTITGGNLNLSSTYPSLTLEDTNNNSDYRITNNDGQFIIYDITNGVHRLNVNADGHVDILGNLDVGAGLDVTGNITATGNEHKFTAGTSGDLTLILQADSDNNNEGDNPKLLFRQDGEHDEGAIFLANNEFNIASTVAVGGGINLRTSTTNSGYATAPIRMSISPSGQIDFEGNVDCNAGLDVTGNIIATGEIRSQDDIRIQSAYPRLYLTDTDSNDDFSLINNNGSFLIYNDTQNDFRLKIDGTTGQCAMNLRPTIDSNFSLGTNALRWANVYADTLYGAGSNITALNASNISSGTVAAARLDTATTQSAGDNSTKIATTAYTDTAIANLIDSSPSTLNTLNELASALGDDPNFATTVTNSIATKLPLAGGTLTGNLTIQRSSGASTLLVTSGNNYATLEIGGSTGAFIDLKSPASDDYDTRFTHDGFIYAKNNITLSPTSGNVVNVARNLNAQEGLDVTGNITVTGTVDGRDLAADGSKLDTYQANGSSYLRSDVGDTYAGGVLNIRTNSSTGHFWGFNITYNSGWKYLTTGGYGWAFRNGGSNGFEVRVSSAAGTADASATLKNFYFKPNGTLNIDGGTAFHTSNDGSGSGLDADTLDGVQGASYLRSDANDNVGGVLTFVSGGGLDLATNNISAGMRIINNGNPSSDGMYIGYGNANSGATRVFGGGATSNGLSVVGSGNNDVKIAGNTVFHAGNDGSGSNLDSDTVDGIHAASFLRSDANDSASGTLNLNGKVVIGNSLTRPSALDSDADAHCRIGGSDVYLYVASLGAGGGYKVAMQAARASDFASFILNLQANGGELQRGGNKVWDAGNDGGGSGLDADTLDGVQGASYLRSDAADTFSGNLTGSSGTNIKLDSNVGTNNNTAFDSMSGYLEFTNDYSDAPRGANKIRLQTDNNWLAGFGISANSHDIYTGGNFNFYKSNSTTSFTHLMSLSSTGELGLKGNLRIDIDSNVDGIVGEAYNNYFGLKHADQTLNTEYMILSKDFDTFISATSGYKVRIRAGGNDSSNELQIGSGNDALTWRGNKVFHAGNDGSGTGLDADTVDGIQGSSLLRSDANDTYTGTLSLAGHIVDSGDSRSVKLMGGTTNSQPFLGVGEQNQYGMKIRWDSGSKIEFDGFWNSSVDGTRNRDLGDINVNTSIWNFPTGVLINSSTAWHAGNDGSGSGLDADTLDGQQGSYYADAASYVKEIRTDDDITARMDSGFYETSTATTAEGWPETTNSWYHLIASTHSNTGNYYSMQIAGDFFYQKFYIRNTNNSGTRAWSEIWTSSSDGSGSGLDADTLDGVNGANYVRTDQNTTITSDLFIGGGAGGITVNGGSDIRFSNGDWTGNTTNGKIQLHSNYLYIAGGSNGIIFRENNVNRWQIEGSGHFRPETDSTYDIGTNSIRVRNGYFDTLYGDGSNITNVNATTLDSIDSGSFLRSDADDTMSANLTVDNGTSTTLSVKCDNAGLALIRANGDSQGTGAVEVGQSNIYGGGIAYNGDGSPSFASGESSDHIMFYRLDNGTRTEVFHYPYNSNTVNFNATPTVGGSAIWHSGNDGSGSGLDADTLDGVQGSSYLRSDAADTGTTLTLTDALRTDRFEDQGGAFFWKEGLNSGRHRHLNLADTTSDPASVNDSHNPTGISWGQRTDNNAYYMLGLKGAYNNGYSNHSRLTLAWHTGIEIGATATYGGVRFMGDTPFMNTTEIMQVNSSGGHVKVKNNLYANNGGLVWNANNDGSGTGLDADTLDGSQANAFIRSGAQSSVSGWHISAYRNGSGTSPHMYFSHNAGYGMHINTYNTSDSVYAFELNSNSKVLFQVFNSGRCIHGGNVLPGAGNSYDLGSSSARWNNVYVNDMHFSNEGKTNDVDGSWGDWTLQEGENDIFMINNRSGKKFKIAMIPV